MRISLRPTVEIHIRQFPRLPGPSSSIHFLRGKIVPNLRQDGGKHLDMLQFRSVVRDARSQGRLLAAQQDRGNPRTSGFNHSGGGTLMNRHIPLLIRRSETHDLEFGPVEDIPTALRQSFSQEMTDADPNTEWLRGSLALDAKGLIKMGAEVQDGWPLRRGPPICSKQALPESLRLAIYGLRA